MHGCILGFIDRIGRETNRMEKHKLEIETNLRIIQKLEMKIKKNELQPNKKSPDIIQKCKYSIERKQMINQKHQFEIQENMRAIEDAKGWLRSYFFEIE